MVKCLTFVFFITMTTLSYGQSDTALLEAEKDVIYYSADIITADLITEVAKLKGNVKILFDEYELTAQNAQIFKKESKLKAWGDVRIQGNNSYIEADEADLNYKTQKGEIVGVRLTSGQMLLEAKRVEKVSNDVYVAKKAKFTTCVTCPPSWRIKGKQIETNINEYIDIKGGRVQILNQSIFPLPRLILPINTRRKTGFLPPAIENSAANLDLGLSVPYFWAIDPHRDLTLTPTIYINDIFDKEISVGGARVFSEYRQWLGSKSRLGLQSALMYDDTYLDIDNTPAPTERWFIHYDNYFVLPKNVVQRSQFTLLKERVYLNDFENEVFGRGEAALKNSFSLSKTKSNRFMSAEAIYYINLLVDDPAQTDNFYVHKLPELNYTITETPFFKNRLLFNANATYTNFIRNTKSYDEITVSPDPDDPSRTIRRLVDEDNLAGSFDTTKDLIRTGQRLRLNAEVSAPFKFGDLFDLRTALNYRDSYYHFNVSEEATVNNDSLNPYSQFAFSRYLELSQSIRTEFSKVYFGQIKHKLIPEIIYRIGSPVDQSENVFFNGGDGDNDLPYHRQYLPITDDTFNEFRHGVQFDYWDRFFRADVLELSLTNLLIRKRQQELVTYYDQPFYFNLTQLYDFRNQEFSDNPDPWSNLNGVLKLRTKYFESFTQASHFHKARQTNITTSNKFIYSPGKYFIVTYSDFLNVYPNGTLVPNSRTQNISPGLGWSFPTFSFSGRFQYSLIAKKQLGWSTNVNYTPIGNCWGIGVRLWRLDRDPKLRWDLQFSFSFGPDPKAQKSRLNI